MTGQPAGAASRARRRGRRVLSAVRRRLGQWRRVVLAPGSSLPRRARSSRADPGLVPVVAELEAILFATPRRSVALLVDERSDWLPSAVAQRWPGLELVCGLADAVGLTAPEDGRSSRLVQAVAATAADRHALLAAQGPFDVIVDAASRSEQERLQVLRDVFFHLRKRGVYLVGESGNRDPAGDGESVRGFVRRLDALTSMGGAATDRDPDEPWARALRVLPSRPATVVTQCRRTAWPKLRYAEVDVVLTHRRPPPGAVLTVLPPLTWSSRAEVVQNRVGRPGAFPAQFDVPSLALRTYTDVRCLPYQVLVAGRQLLPDSYRHHTAKRMINHRLREVSAFFDEYRYPAAKARRLPGKYFYLGSEYPQTYGHVLTEQLSRLWAWPEAKRRHPDLRALVEVRPGDAMRPFELELFGAAGIDADDLVAVAGPVRVETLVAAAPMLVNISYVHPGIREVWDGVATRLRARASGLATAEKIFVARRQGGGRRDCRNADELESVFRQHGFVVVYPEELPLPEQVALFEGARVVAGYAGSGLFHLQFCREPKDVVLIRTTSYGARNEYLMASIRGHRLRVLWCDPDISQPASGWSRAAFHSSFAVDLKRDGAFLEEQLRQL